MPVKFSRIVLDLAVRDFKVRYLGSYLGILWAFIQPAIYMAMLWLIFQLGFKNNPIDQFPYLLWLMAGLIPWFFFSEGLTNASQAVVENSHLVKKVVFRTSLLPVIKILSSLFVHLVFIGIIFAAYLFYGYAPNPYYLQIFYYLFASLFLLLGLSFLTSALVVFVRDIGPAISVLLNFGFWMTPIFWNLKMLPERYQFFIKLNPVYYITEGYRNSLIYHVGFWQHPIWSLYFWAVTLLIFGVGFVAFRKLKPHFADVL